MPGPVLLSGADRIEAHLAGRRLVSADDVRAQIAAFEAGTPRPPHRTARSRRRVNEAATVQVRRAITARERVLAARVECPVCGWTGRAFRPKAGSGRILRGVRCPACGAAQRHRLFILAWRDEAPSGGTCLHFAPERWLTPHVASNVDSVVALDLERSDAAVFGDAARLPMRSGAFRTVVCNDVCEHVEDDRAALREIARALAPDGRAFVHVPIVSTQTVEYGFANPVDHGHRRAYGPDVAHRFAESGLDATLYARPDAERRHGLSPADGVFVCRRA